MEQDQELDVLDAMADARRDILNLAEAMCERHRWKYFRKQLLNIMGNAGLEGKLCHILGIKTCNPDEVDNVQG